MLQNWIFIDTSVKEIYTKGKVLLYIYYIVILQTLFMKSIIDIKNTKNKIIKNKNKENNKNIKTLIKKLLKF